jgi:hypothetical protein
MQSQKDEPMAYPYRDDDTDGPRHGLIDWALGIAHERSFSAASARECAAEYKRRTGDDINLMYPRPSELTSLPELDHFDDWLFLIQSLDYVQGSKETRARIDRIAARLMELHLEAAAPRPSGGEACSPEFPCHHCLVCAP